MSAREAAGLPQRRQGPLSVGAALLLRAERDAELALALLRMLAFVVLIVLLRIYEFADTRHGLLLSFAAYAVAVLAALVLAARGVAPAWLASALTGLDVLLLLHFLTMLVFEARISPDATLAAPASAMIYLVLAQAAVRHRPGLILLALGLFLSGYAALEVLAAASLGMADHAEGWQAEAIRLATLILVGVTLYVATLRTRRILDDAVREAEMRAGLARFVPEPLVTALSGSGVEAASALTCRRREVAVLFVDMRAFTRHTENLPEAGILAFVTEYRRRLVGAVVESGGVVDKFMGDAVLAVFAPSASTSSVQSARGAIRSGFAIVRGIEAWNKERAARGEPRVDVGVGLHQGPVILGAIGDWDGADGSAGLPTRLEWSVLGETVNIAQRIERLTSELDRPLLASDAVLEAAGERRGPAWRLVVLPERPLRGSNRAIEIYEPSGTTGLDSGSTNRLSLIDPVGQALTRSA